MQKHLRERINGFSIIQIFVLIVIFAVMALVIQSMITSYQASLKRKHLETSRDLIESIINGSLINSVAALSYTSSKCGLADIINYPQNPIFCLCLKEKKCLHSGTATNATPDGFPFILYRSDPTSSASAIAGGMVSFCAQPSFSSAACLTQASKAQYLDSKICSEALELESGNACVETSAPAGIPASYANKILVSKNFVTTPSGATPEERTKILFNEILTGTFSIGTDSLFLLPQNMARYSGKGERCTKNDGEPNTKFIERCPFAVDLRFKVACTSGAASCAYAADNIHICYTIHHDDPKGKSSLTATTNVKSDGTCTTLREISDRASGRYTAQSGSASSGSSSLGSGSSFSGTGGSPTSSGSESAESDSSSSGEQVVSGSSVSSSGTSIISQSSLSIAPMPKRKLASGESHDCAIHSDGTLWCWGEQNFCGQLGNADPNFSTGNSPVQIAAGSTFSSVVTERFRSCAIKTDGSLWCWGCIINGNLGFPPEPGDPDSPFAVGSTFSGVALGSLHSCAIKTDGTLWCWGWNLGDPLVYSSRANYRLSAVQIAEGSLFSSVAAGGSHSCAIKTDGSLWCWGWNNYGQLGDNTTMNKTTPVPIAAGSTFSSVELGSGHSCAIKTNGTLWCWGWNNYGQLGDNTTTNKTTPVQISEGSTFSSIDLGGDVRSCATKTDGSLWCWGAHSTSNRTTPVEFAAPSKFSSFALGGRICAIKTDGSLWCWVEQDQPPVQIIITGASSVALGDQHSCAIKTDDTLWCWVRNSNGQLRMRTILGVSSVALGYQHSCAIKTDGSLWCWEDIYSNQIFSSRNNSNRITPVAISAGSKFSSIAMVSTSICAIKTNGTLWCWSNGDYYHGQSGPAARTSPVQVSVGSTFTHLAFGAEHSCAIETGGTLWCWGKNYNGQLGDNTTSDRTTPVQIAAPSKFSSIALGAGHSCAIKTDGSLWCWGKNDNGQLGDNFNTQKTTPVQIAFPSTFTHIALGGDHSCAIKTGGSLWCWGKNDNGQLGDVSIINQTSPVQISVGSTFTHIDLGNVHSCAVKTGGSLWCWGNNSYSQLGLGTSDTGSVHTPTLNKVISGARDPNSWAQ